MERCLACVREFRGNNTPGERKTKTMCKIQLGILKTDRKNTNKIKINRVIARAPGQRIRGLNCTNRFLLKFPVLLGKQEESLYRHAHCTVFASLCLDGL